jgi:hypothetical protein
VDAPLPCRSLLTQEGICLMLEPDFRFLEVAYPYVAKRLLTDEDPALRQRLIEVHLQLSCAPMTAIHSSQDRRQAHVCRRDANLVRSQSILGNAHAHHSGAKLAWPYMPVQLARRKRPVSKGPEHCALASAQVLFRDNKFQWKRLQNLIQLAKEGTGDAGLDLSDTLSDGARMVFLDPRLRQQLIMALTEDNRLHIQVSS